MERQACAARLNVPVEPRMLEQVKLIAATEDRTLAAVVRLALRAWLKSRVVEPRA